MFSAVLGTFLVNVLLGAAGFAIILASTAEYWLGTKYKLDAKGASARTGVSLTSIEWGDVKRVVTDSEGIKLTPLEKEGRMEAFRGVFLRFGREDRERILNSVRTLGGKDIATLG